MLYESGLRGRFLTLSSLIFITLVRKRSSRLVQASRWLSDVRVRKYATASLHTLGDHVTGERERDTEEQRESVCVRNGCVLVTLHIKKR